MVNIKVKKLSNEAVLPKFARLGDAGADLTAISKEEYYGYVVYGTGLAFEIPEGYCMKIYPRSSIFKYHMILSNSVGVIDSKYRGEVKFVFKKTECEYNSLVMHYSIGDRIGQAVIEKLVDTEYIETEELDMKRVIEAKNYLLGSLYPNKNGILKDINDFKLMEKIHEI